MEAASLGLRVDGISNIDQASSSLGGFVSSAEKAERSANSLSSSSDKSVRSLNELGRSSSSATSGISSLTSVAIKAGAALGVAFSAGAIIRYADAWSDMQSRIGAVIGDMDAAGGSMQRILQIANASYSPISQTAEVYSRNVATFRDLGRSASEAADFTEAVNNAMVVTATRGENAAVVINSLSRSLAVGKLDADAFDTIVSRSPRTLKAVADQLGVTTSALRQMARDGKVTSDVIAKGLISSLDDLRKEAAEMPATMSDAFVRVNNNFTAFVGTVDQATGASEALAAKIISISDAALQMATSEDSIAGMVEAYESWSGTIAALANDFIQLDKILSEFSGNAQDDASSISLSFSEMPANIRAMIQIATIEIASFIDAQMNGIQALAAAVKALPQGPAAAAAAFNAVREQMAGLGQARLDSITAALAERDAIVQAGKDSASSYRNTRRAALEFNSTIAEGNKPVAALTSEQKKAAKAMEDFAAKSALAVASTRALADAYLISEEAVAKANRQQKIDAEVLKLGEKNRAAVTKRINEQEDALEALDLSKNIADMRKQNAGLEAYGKALLAGGNATRAGREALTKYNDEREIEAALVGKTSEEITKLLPKLREEQRIRGDRSLQNSNIERMNELVNETRTSTERANAELADLRELASSTENPKYLEAISRKIVEIENETNIWAKATQGAIDRVDQVGAEFWKSFLDGGKFSFSSLKDIAKQWAAEMLNMMTFKPLLTSFSNMLFNTNNSGGIGDVWGGLLGGSGGGGSGGGGGGFGNIISIGKNLYSAYNAITGVGAEMLAGWQSGGFTGAAQAGAGYYGNMISGAYTAITNWFTGGAAQAAMAEGAAQGAGQFASQFVANLGQQVSWNATQGVASGAAQAAGTGAASGAASGSMLNSILSSVMGAFTNPMTWVTAGVIASWKLYDQGVMAKPDQARASFEGANDYAQLIGKTRMFETYGFELIDKFREIENWILHPLPSAIIGSDKLAAVSTGSPVFQAVTQMLGRLLGGGEQFKRTVGSAQGLYSGGDYTGTGAVEGWFGGARRFGDDFDSALHGLNETFAKSLGGLFDMFDIDSDIMTSAAGRLRRTSGRLAAEFTATFEGQAVTVMGQYGRKGNIQASMEQWFDDVMGRGMVEAISKSSLPEYLKEVTAGLTTSESVGSAIAGLFQRFDGVNTALESISLTAFGLTDAGLRSADALLNLSASIAGLENPTSADKMASLGQLTSAFYSGFIPQSEAFVASMANIRSQFEALDTTLPGSRKGFRDLVGALDLTSEAGRKAFATYMQLSETMAGYYTSMEQLEAGYLASFGTAGEQQAKALADLSAEFSRLGVGMPLAREGFRSLIEGIDITTTAGQDLRTQLLSLAPAMSSYIGSLEQQKQALRDAQGAASDSVAGGLSNLREQIFLDQLGTNESKYGYYKSQADALAALLPSLTDITAIQDVSNRWIALAGSAYGLLDEQGKKQQGGKYINELDMFQSLSNDQIAKSQDKATEAQIKAVEASYQRVTETMVKQLEQVYRQNETITARSTQMIESMSQQFSQALAVLLRGGGGQEVNYR